MLFLMCFYACLNHLLLNSVFAASHNCCCFTALFKQEQICLYQWQQEAGGALGARCWCWFGSTDCNLQAALGAHRIQQPGLSQSHASGAGKGQ